MLWPLAAMRKKNISGDFRGHTSRRPVREMTHHQLAGIVSGKSPAIAIRTKVKLLDSGGSHGSPRWSVPARRRKLRTERRNQRDANTIVPLSLVADSVRAGRGIEVNRGKILLPDAIHGAVRRPQPRIRGGQAASSYRAATLARDRATLPSASVSGIRSR
jgi:hypothetical protein